MRVSIYQQPVNVPDVSEFANEYPQYGVLARGDGKFLFDLIMSPNCYIAAHGAVINHNLPAISGVAEACHKAVQAQTVLPWSSHTKQFLGALVSTLMVANGFKKTNTKKAVPHPAFTKAELHTL